MLQGLTRFLLCSLHLVAPSTVRTLGEQKTEPLLLSVLQYCLIFTFTSFLHVYWQTMVRINEIEENLSACNFDM